MTEDEKRRTKWRDVRVPLHLPFNNTLSASELAMARLYRFDSFVPKYSYIGEEKPREPIFRGERPKGGKSTP